MGYINNLIFKILGVAQFISVKTLTYF